MAGFSASLSDMRQDAYEMEQIASKLRKKSGILERLGVNAQNHSWDAGRQIARANRQLGEDVGNISQMSEALQCIAGLYDRAENEAALNLQYTSVDWCDILDGTIDFQSGEVQKVLAELREKEYAYSAIWPGVIGSMFVEDFKAHVIKKNDNKDTLLGKVKSGEVDGGKFIEFGTRGKQKENVSEKPWKSGEYEYEYDEKQRKIVKQEKEEKKTEKKKITEKDIAENITIAEFSYSFLDEDEKEIVIYETEDGTKISLDKKDIYIKNKLTAGSWESSIGAEYSRLSLETGEGKIGNDIIGGHGSLSMDVLSVSTGFKAGMGWLNDEGEIDPQLYAGVNAEAVVAKVSGEVGLDLLGADVDVKGSVGLGMGFHADVGLDDGKLKLNVGGYVGIGGDVSLEVDVSGVINAVENVVEFAEDAVGVIGDAVDAAGDFVKNGGKLLGDIGGAILNGWKKFSLW